MLGMQIPKALNFNGCVNKHVISVLVDLGSTHNFLQSRITKYLGHIIEPSPNFSHIGWEW